jgi:DNA-directed RNA polymerase subunit RPC12/RpoP
MDTTKLQTEINYSLECPYCRESLSVKLRIATWAEKCVREVGYGNDYADESNNLPIKCEECGHEFEIDGVE